MANFRNRLSSPAHILSRCLLWLFVLVLFCSFANADGIADGFIHGYGFDNTYSDLTGSNSGRPLTLKSGTISFTNDGFIGQAVSMQDKGYVRIEDAYKTAFGIADGKDGKMTFLCWYNPSKFVTDGNPLTTNKNWTSGKNAGLILDGRNTNAGYGIRYNIADGSDRIDLDSGVTTVADQWQFAAITVDLSTNQAYLYYGTADGTLQSKGPTNTSNIDSLLNTSNYWFFGIDYSASHYFNGRIDEAGFWNRALSETEINQIYTAQKAGTSLASQINLAASATTAQEGSFADASTWAGGVAPSVDANVEINNAVTSDSRTFNGDAVIGADGSLTAAGCVYVGHSNDGVASLTINGGENVFSGTVHNSLDSSLIIGYEGGVGKFILNDGTVTTSGYTYIGYTTAEGSEFIQNGGTFNSGDNIGLAYYANDVGSMRITNGEMNVNGGIRIGLGANSTGQMTVSGGKVTTIDFELGHADSGDAAKLEITGGSVEVTGAVYGAKNANSGNLYVSGTGQLVFNSTATSNGIRDLTSFQIEGSGSDGTGALLFKQSLTGASPITLTGNTTIGVEPGATFTQTAAITELSGTSCGLTVTGGGSLVLSQAPDITGPITVEAGTLDLPGSLTINNLSGGSIGENDQIIPATLTVNGDLTLNNDAMSTFIGSITADTITVNTLNDVALKLYADANNKVTADSLTISSGELDFKGYFEGSIEVINGAVFSPGNSVGTADITGDITFTSDTASNGFALFEFGEYTGEDVNHDLFVMDGAFTADSDVIMLDFAYNDADKWATEGNSFKLVSGGGFTDGKDYSSWLASTPDYSSLFNLTGGADGLYLVGIKAAPDPGSGVPEPSTWALLALGVAGLMYIRKRK